MKKTLLFLPLASISLLSCSLSRATLEFEYNSLLTPDELFYYTGDQIDKVINLDGVEVTLIPSFYVAKDGVKIEDLDYKTDIQLSGFDLNAEGQQTVKAECITNKTLKPIFYNIIVLETRVVYISASDLFHSRYGSYKVGEKFAPTFMDGDIKRGVNISLTYNDPFRKTENYFGDDEALEGITYDLSSCKVDEENRFTEAGEYNVKVTYSDASTSYSITVEESN